MGLSFRLTAMKGLMMMKKKMKKARKNRTTFIKTDSKPDTTRDQIQIPDDVLMEILSRLPIDSLMMCKCVSKLWSSLITCRYFTNTFFKSPSPQSRRRRFMYLIDKDGQGDSALLSASPLNRLEQFCILTQDLTIQGTRGCLVNALRGLMCFRIGTRVNICNITTKQHVELPLVRSSFLEDDDSKTMWNYFGYDHTKDEYKVVSIVSSISKEERVVRSEHHVFVLGLGSSWRILHTPPPPPHAPCSQGLSIDGVLYYGALNYDNTFVIVSFDLSSEDFTMIQLPLETTTRANNNIISYEGKVGIFDYSRLESEYKIDLWVVEDAGNSQWSDKKTFVLPMFHIRIILHGELLVECTGRSGEIILKNPSFDKSNISVYIVYDLEKCKEVGAGGISPVQHNSFDTDSLRMTYLDDTESIMYLQV